MTLGVVMLVHTALHRAETVAQRWTDAGCPVVIHADGRMRDAKFEAFRQRMSSNPLIRFCPRYRCDWGTWSIVAASEFGAELLLEEFPQVERVLLTSGSCLPLRPIRELQAYLDWHPDTDFIEARRVADANWIQGGLSEERFTLRFPFKWKTNRRLFDAWVRIQRTLRLTRKVPQHLDPHLGSQWWCLTRKTLTAIFNDPKRRTNRRFFRKSWIPDESYFQTLAFQHSARLENRSLTLSKFDHLGVPFIFYDDHLELLKASEAFIARKVWTGADKLYETFPLQSSARPGDTPGATQIIQLFDQANTRRSKGRAGLTMQSRMIRAGGPENLSCSPYTVLYGFDELFAGFTDWLHQISPNSTHDHLFARDHVGYGGGKTLGPGALAGKVTLRDYDTRAFLSNLIWNTKGQQQTFLFGPGDRQEVSTLLARDPNARVSVISGAWAIGLFRSGQPMQALKQQAQALHNAEAQFLSKLRRSARDTVNIWTLEAFCADLPDNLDCALPAQMVPLPHQPTLHDLAGFSSFIQSLKAELPLMAEALTIPGFAYDTAQVAE